jgi:3-oxoacyl-[acyl-carrier-protein] synthase II
VGAINPMGNSVEEMWQAMKNCESGVARTTIFDASNFPSKIAAEIKNWDISRAGQDPKKWKHAGRHTKFAIGAAQQAVESSGILENGMPPMRLGVYLGAGEGDQDFSSFARMMTAALQGDTLDLAELTRVGLETINPFMELEQEPNMPSGHVAGVFNAQGPNFNCLTACAASNQAIGEATELIRRGAADAMISGGTHSMIHPFGVTGFNLLTALSTRNDEPTKASRPFDRLRDGFVLGEGSAIVILEELEHAKKRGAHIWGEIAGYGTTADAFRITDIHPDGRGAIGCMNLALEDAGASPDDVDYINAHGTSTSVNDRVESVSCKVVFGERAYQIPTSSTKSMMGHLIAAAGVTEAIICLLAIRDNLAPPTINYENPDPECDLDYVPNEPREAKIDLALNNSFGFGGQNVTLALSRFTG